MLFEGQKRQRMARSEISLLWKNFQVGQSGAQPLQDLPFGMRELLVWGEDAGAVQFHWLCLAGSHPVGTAGPGHGCTDSVSCLRAQQQPGLHCPHCNGQLIFRQANPVLLSFVSRDLPPLCGSRSELVSSCLVFHHVSSHWSLMCQ